MSEPRAQRPSVSRRPSLTLLGDRPPGGFGGERRDLAVHQPEQAFAAHGDEQAAAVRQQEVHPPAAEHLASGHGDEPGLRQPRDPGVARPQVDLASHREGLRVGPFVREGGEGDDRPAVPAQQRMGGQEDEPGAGGVDVDDLPEVPLLRREKGKQGDEAQGPAGVRLQIAELVEAADGDASGRVAGDGEGGPAPSGLDPPPPSPVVDQDAGAVGHIEEALGIAGDPEALGAGVAFRGDVRLDQRKAALRGRRSHGGAREAEPAQEDAEEPGGAMHGRMIRISLPEVAGGRDSCGHMDLGEGLPRPGQYPRHRPRLLPAHAGRLPLPR